MGCDMSWIEGVGPPDLPDIFQALSINPEALEAVKHLNETLSFGNSSLGRVREEAIATVVAVANRCRFGALTHSGFFRQYTGDQHTAANMLVNHHLAGLDPADRQMLDFAVQATVKPHTLTQEDIESLRRVGFDDEEILSIILVTCLVNFMNRLADSLGIDIPASYQTAIEKWLVGPAGRQPWLMRPVSQRTRNPDESPLAGSLGHNGWGTYGNRGHGDAPNSLIDSLFGDSQGHGRHGANGELHSNGAEDPVNLGDLADLLAEGNLQGMDAPNGMWEDGEQRDPAGMGAAGHATVMPDDRSGAGLGIEERGQTKPQEESDLLPSHLAEPHHSAPPPDHALGQPPGETNDAEYTAGTTPLDGSGTQAAQELESGLVNPQEEEPAVILVDPNNPVVRFVEETCVVQDGEVTSARDLYITYLGWCDDNIEPPMPQRSFGMILNQMGFNRRRRGRGRNWSWWGLGLAGAETSDEDEDADMGFSADQEDDE